MSELVPLKLFSPFSSLTFESKLVPGAAVSKLIQHVLGIFGAEFPSLHRLGTWESAGAAIWSLLDGSSGNSQVTAGLLESKFDKRDDFGGSRSFAVCKIATDGRSIAIKPATGSLTLSFTRLGAMLQIRVEYSPTASWTRADLVSPRDAATQQRLIKDFGIAVGDGVLNGPITIGGTSLALESLSLTVVRYDLVERDDEGQVVREFKLSDEVREFLRS